MSQSLDAIHVTLRQVAEQIAELKAMQAEQGRALQILIRLDTEHANTAKALGRAFDQIEQLKRQHEALDAQVPERLPERLLELEKDRPINSLTSGWVLKAVFLAAVAAAAFVWGGAVERHRAPSSQTSTLPQR